MRSIGNRISGAAECQGDCGAIEPTKPTTEMKWRLSIFEVALAIASAERNLRSGFPYCGYKEWQPAGNIGLCFLLPEAELRRRLGQGSRLQVLLLRNCSLGRSIAFTEIFDYESITKIQGSLVPAIWPT